MMDRIAGDVVVIGTGPSGAAVAERLLAACPSAAIVVLERGPMALSRHFYDSGASIRERDEFLAAHRICPWTGDLGQGGAILPILGGRGVVGGAQLHRFYEADLTGWEAGRWPFESAVLTPYFELAERQLLGDGRSFGPAQEHAVELLSRFSPRHPPHSRVSGGRGVVADGGFPHRSAVERLLALEASTQAGGLGRVDIITDARAVRLISDSSDPAVITRVRCRRNAGAFREEFDVEAGLVVLAASAVESTRLVMLSDLEGTASSDTLGRYLAEHIYVRGTLDVSGSGALAHGAVNLFLPPPGDGVEERFQIELRSIGPRDGVSAALRVTGSAAMDPVRDNRVTLSEKRSDELGIPMAHTVILRTDRDQVRTRELMQRLEDVARGVGGTWTSRPQVLPTGASYHEAGTMRIGDTSSNSEQAADVDGLLLGTRNVYVGDAAAFPCVGAANPILTLTAMGYRLADRLAEVLNHA